MNPPHKKIFSVLIALILLLPVAARAYYNPGSPAGFVNDYAGLLSESIKSQTEQTLAAFAKETSNEISVVTIQSLEGDTIENFAVKLFEDWGIGKADKDNGVLVLIAKDDREMRIEVGYGLEGALTDAQSFWIINNVMKPAFQAEDYGKGTVEAVNLIMGATKGEYVPSASEAQNNGEARVDYGFLFYLGFFVFIWLASILGRSKRWWPGGVIGGIGGVIIGLVKASLIIGAISLAGLGIFGLLFDYFVSKSYREHKQRGLPLPWWIGGGHGRGGHGGFGGFGGFGGGLSGGGGASGRW